MMNGAMLAMAFTRLSLRSPLGTYTPEPQIPTAPMWSLSMLSSVCKKLTADRKSAPFISGFS